MDQNAIKILKEGGVGVLPTDTMYGLVGSALSKNTVDRIYRIKGRAPNKPFIILISDLNNLNYFSIKIDTKTKNFLKKIWPNPVSVILPCDEKKFTYLHRGAKTLAFRMPDKKELLELLRQTGPLVTPSANPEGLPPAQNIEEAKKYFGDQVDFYVDQGTLTSQPSTLVKIKHGKIIILREGAFRINNQEG